MPVLSMKFCNVPQVKIFLVLYIINIKLLIHRKRYNINSQFYIANILVF